jgi:hypothetical protein
MNPPPPNLGDRDLDGPGDPSLPKNLGQKPKDTWGPDASGRLFCWKRALRGVGVSLSLLWFVLFHVGIISQAPFRVPFRVRLGHTIITVLVVSIFVLCLRGLARTVLGWLMVLFAVWTLWGYWRLPAAW